MPLWNVTKPEIALELFADRGNFKLYMGDTGLLVSQIMKSRDKSDEDLYKSFDYLKKKYQLKMQDSYIIYTKDLRYEDEILYVPIYMTMLI